MSSHVFRRKQSHGGPQSICIRKGQRNTEEQWTRRRRRRRRRWLYVSCRSSITSSVLLSFVVNSFPFEVLLSPLLLSLSPLPPGELHRSWIRRLNGATVANEHSIDHDIPQPFSFSHKSNPPVPGSISNDRHKSCLKSCNELQFYDESLCIPHAGGDKSRISANR